MADSLLQRRTGSNLHSGIKRKSPSIDNREQEPPLKKHKSNRTVSEDFPQINGIDVGPQCADDDLEGSPPLIIFAAQKRMGGDFDSDESLDGGDPEFDECSDSFYEPAPRRKFRSVLNPDIIQGLQHLIPSETVNPFYHRFMDMNCRLNLWRDHCDSNDSGDSVHSAKSSDTEPISECASMSATAPPADLTKEEQRDLNVNSISFTRVAGDESSQTADDLSAVLASDPTVREQENERAEKEEEEEQMKRGSVEGGGPPVTDPKDTRNGDATERIKAERLPFDAETCPDNTQSERKEQGHTENERMSPEIAIEQHEEATMSGGKREEQHYETTMNGGGCEEVTAEVTVSEETAEQSLSPNQFMNLCPNTNTDEMACCDGDGEEELEDDNQWNEEEEDRNERDEAMKQLNGFAHHHEPDNQVIELLSDDTESDEMMTNNNDEIESAVAADHGHGDAVNGDNVSECVEETNDKQTEFMRYPPKSPKPVIITIGDIGRLRPETYLNDSLIDFYLKYLYEEVLSKEQRENVFCFNQFFYTKLDQAIDEKNEKLRMKLAKWTKGCNIFDKSMVIIPINISLHWSLCVITFPGHCSPIPKEEEEKPVGESIEAMCREEILSMISRNVVGEPDWVRSLETDRRVQAISKYQTKILHFDSMRGCHPSFEIFNKLRIYLDDEWKRKCPDSPRSFTMSTFPGISLGVPQQRNSADCGVFLLHFAEKFCLSPFYDAGSCLTRDHWFSQNEVTRKRQEIKELCISLRREQGKRELDVDSVIDRLRITVESQSGCAMPNHFASMPYSIYNNGGVSGNDLNGGYHANGYGALNGYHDRDVEEEEEDMGDSDFYDELEEFEDRIWDTDDRCFKSKIIEKCNRNPVLRRFIEDIINELEEENRPMGRHQFNNHQMYHRN